MTQPNQEKHTRLLSLRQKKNLYHLFNIFLFLCPIDFLFYWFHSPIPFSSFHLFYTFFSQDKILNEIYKNYV